MEQETSIKKSQIVRRSYYSLFWLLGIFFGLAGLIALIIMYLLQFNIL